MDPEFTRFKGNATMFAKKKLPSHSEEHDGMILISIDYPPIGKMTRDILIGFLAV